LDEDAYKWLRQQSWPGNVRELKNLIGRTILIIDKETLRGEDFQLAVQQVKDDEAAKQPVRGSARTLEEVEKEEIIRAIHDCEGNMSMAAEVLGISRATLYRKINKYNIKI
ncbi:MAG: helix-turn-helix domain-containing protein, partial [Bacteroidales bacterium]